MRKFGQNKVALLLKRENEVWLYSYADLITNLLAFFILLFTISQASKMNRLKIKNSFAMITGQEVIAPNMPDFANSITTYLKEAQIDNQVAIQSNHEGISLTFQGGLFFDTLSSQLTAEAQVLLDQVAPLLKKLPSEYRIDISGHADSRPIVGNANYPSNWELSAARAGSVVRYLASKNVSAKRMRAIGYADTQPLSNDLESNRRVVIQIGKGEVK